MPSSFMGLKASACGTRGSFGIQVANGHHTLDDVSVVFVGVFVNRSAKWYSTMWKHMKRATSLPVPISCDDATTSVWQEF